MCLTLDSNGQPQMGCGDFCKPQVAPTTKASQLQSNIEVLLIVHVCVSIGKMVGFGFGAGLEDWLSCLILYCGKSRIDYCFLLMYMYSVVAMMCTIIISLLFFWQQSVNTTSDEDTDEITDDESLDVYDFDAIRDTDINQLRTSLVITSIVLVFYTGAVYFTFDAYKEFKGLVEDQRGPEALRQNNIILYGTLPERGRS